MRTRTPASPCHRARIPELARDHRTREFERPKPAGLLRVVCIGGSTTVAGRTNEETYLVQKMVREFAEREVAPLIKEYDRRQEMAPFILPRLAELGILGIPFPVRWGGQGFELSPNASERLFRRLLCPTERCTRGTRAIIAGGIRAALGRPGRHGRLLTGYWEDAVIHPGGIKDVRGEEQGTCGVAS